MSELALVGTLALAFWLSMMLGFLLVSLLFGRRR